MNSRAMAMARQPAPRVAPRGPVARSVAAVFTLLSATLISWMLGTLIEVAGVFWFWPAQGEGHSRAMVAEDLAYIAAAPRSLLVEDTRAFSQQVLAWVRRPYQASGVVGWCERTRTASPGHTALGRLGRAAAWRLSQCLMISMFVAQDTLLRLAVAAFALPAFALACLLGAVDGLMRRDLRRWGGGRESSFVYHHAKRWTLWSLTIGFTVYLAWPFGGFNPAYMVLVFTALVAAFLSTTLSAFKKYL